MKLASKRLLWVTSIVAAFIVAVAVTANLSRAEEPDCAAQRCVQFQQAGVPLLNKLPHLDRLFKNVGVGFGTLQSDCERIGIDFDLVVTGEEDANVACCAAQSCEHQSCAKSACDQICVLSHNADESKCQKCVGHAKAGKHKTKHDKHELEFLAAAYERMLQMQQESFERQRQLIEAVAESQRETGQLEGVLETLEGLDEMREELVEVALENAQLKVQLELAAEQQHLLQQHAALLSENAELKCQLAKRDVASAKTSRAGSRVAKKAALGTKSR